MNSVRLSVVLAAFSLLTGEASLHGQAVGISSITTTVNDGSGETSQNLNGATTDFYNALTAVVMLIGRFGTLIVILAIAGALARQPRNDRAKGSLDPSTAFFGLLVAATGLVVTALTFLPADALGPVAEALILHRHGSF